MYDLRKEDGQMKSTLRISLSLLLLATAVFAGCSQPMSVDVVEVRRGPIRQYIDERGKTRLPEVHLITMPFDGRIEPVKVVEGETLKKGQVVARFVPRDLKLAYAAADAAVQRLDESITEKTDTRIEDVIKQQTESYVKSMDTTVLAAKDRVRAGREKAKFGSDTYERIKKAFDEGAATEEELGRAEVIRIESDVDYQQDVLVHEAMKSLQAATSLFPLLVDKYVETKTLAENVLRKQKDEATAQLEMEKQRSERGVMRSPVDGVVLERAITNERFIAAGRVLLRIGRMEDLEVEADVLSQDVVAVKNGDTVEIYGPAIGTPNARGVVHRVYPTGFTKVSSLGVEQQRVKVVIRFEPADLERLREEKRLGVEFRVRVRIFTAMKDDTLLVPRSALFRGADAKWQVFVVASGLCERRDVDVGLLNDDAAEIIKGLNAGEQVVRVPQAGLEDGSRVNAETRDES